MKKEMSSMHMAIEFAKHLLQSKVTVKRNGKIGEETPSTSYHPAEFQLLLGQLEHNGEEVFKEWVDSVVDKAFDENSPKYKDAALIHFIGNEEQVKKFREAAEKLQATKDKLKKETDEDK